MTLRTILVLLLIVTFVVSSCSSTKSTEKKIQTAETTYLDAMEAFNDEDYLSAMKYFEVIKLQYPASQFADDAQYYTAEINFKRKEFILAAFNYRLLLTTYRSSEYSKSAYFKQALSYYNLSPNFDRDQKYTYEAIQSLTDFYVAYPNDSLSKEALNLINELKNKLARKVYETGIFYKKQEMPRSAVIYFDQVLEEYFDSIYHESAMFEKIAMLHWMKKFEEVAILSDSYKQMYPRGQFLTQLAELSSGKK